MSYKNKNKWSNLISNYTFTKQNILAHSSDGSVVHFYSQASIQPVRELSIQPAVDPEPCCC